MRKRNKVALGIFAVFYVFFGLYISLNQEQIIYLPNQQDFSTCTAFAEAEKVNYQGTRMFVHITPDKPTVVFYHGNADTACNGAFFANMFTQAGHGYVIVEYAGYANDPQKPSHELVKQDVRNVISYLHEQDVPHIVVAGQSIGAAAASYHASLQPPEKLLLISPFTDLLAVAKGRFWFYPTSLLVDNAFDNVSALQNYQGKVLIIHGDKDKLIPYQLGQELYDSLNTKKTLTTIEEADHNYIFNYPETHTAISDFLIVEQTDSSTGP